MQAEGARRTVVVTDEPDKYGTRSGLAPGTTVHHRRELDAVQRAMREIAGTTVIVYDQTCAAEKRRRRKRGKYPDPPKRAFINPAVCEGCGDCGVKSNCVAVVPVETEFGRKRAIDQSSCNKDFSCVEGFCPSFVTVHGGALRKGAGVSREDAALPELPEPSVPGLDRPHEIIVTGVGGTGGHHHRRAAGDGRPPGVEGMLGARSDRPRAKGRGGGEPRADRGPSRRHHHHADRKRRGEPRARLRRGGHRGRGYPRDDAGREDRGGGEHAGDDDRRIHPQRGSRVSGRGADAGHRGCGRRPARGTGRRDADRDGVDRRCHRDQSVHARLRVAEGPHPSVESRHRARHRDQRGRGGDEPERLRLGSAHRGRAQRGGAPGCTGHRPGPRRAGHRLEYRGGAAAGARDPGIGDRAAGGVPGELPGCGVRRPLPCLRRAGAGGRALACEGDARARRGGGPRLLQAPRVQGRVRGRAPARRTGVPAPDRGRIRGATTRWNSTLLRRCSRGAIRKPANPARRATVRG